MAPQRLLEETSYTRVAFNKFKKISTETFCIESNMVMNFLYTL